MAVQRRQQWMRGVLDLCVLGAVREGEAHGYAIAKRLKDGGLGEVQGGTLYPILARLSAAGYLAARWEPGDHGPGRKYYALTPSGRSALQDDATAWHEFTAAAERFIRPKGRS